MTVLSCPSLSTTVTLRRSLPDAANVASIHREDKVIERDMVGTSRTMVNRLGFGSYALTMQVWCSLEDYNKLNAMRGYPVTYEGNTYDLTFPSEPTYILQHNIYRVQIRLKMI